MPAHTATASTPHSAAGPRVGTLEAGPPGHRLATHPTRSSHADVTATGHSMTASPPHPAAVAPPTRSDRGAFEALDWILLLGLSLIWGSSFLLMAVGLRSLHPGVITLVRVGTGAAALLLVRGRNATFEPADDRRLVLLAVIWVVIPFTLFPIAEQHINSAVAGILNGATPIWAALIGTIWFGRPSRGTQRIGLVIGFVGMVLVSVSSTAAGGDSAVLGVVMVLIATIMYGWSVHLLGPLQQRYGAVPVARRTLVISTIGTMPFGLWGLQTSTFEWLPVLATVALGVLGTGLAFVMMAQLSGRVGGSRASFVTYIIPVVAVGLGMALLGDEVAPAALAGVVLVIGGAVAASRPER